MVNKLIGTWQGIMATVTTLAAIVGGAWGLFEYEQLKWDRMDGFDEGLQVIAGAIDNLKDRQDMDRWVFLNDKRRTIGLDQHDHREWCLLGKKLFGDFKCPNWDGRRPRSD